MGEQFEIVGVYPIDAAEPCHLIEVKLRDDNGELDWGAVTQEVKGELRENWQVAYDEQLITDEDGSLSYVFYFHYLDFSKPLVTPYGSFSIPDASTLPPWLQHIEYFPP